MLVTFDCDYDPENTRTIVFDVVVIFSFLIAMWALSVAVKNNQNKLAELRLFQKFGVFKLMIFISKALYKILQLVARKGDIPGYEEWLGGEARAVIWANFVTVIASAILMLINARLYTTEDYETIRYIFSSLKCEYLDMVVEASYS